MPPCDAVGDASCHSVDQIMALADPTESPPLRIAHGSAQLAGLPDLRTLQPPPGEMHVRLWHGDGRTRVRGLLLTRRGPVWTAVALGQLSCMAPRDVSARADWGAIGQRVEALGPAPLAAPHRETR